MKVVYDRAVLKNPLEVMRKAGYSAFTDPNTGEESFVLRTSSEFYPRFHVYIVERGNEIEVSLHLDQKKPSYGQSHAHSGEYEGTTVEREMRRIDGWVGAMKGNGGGGEDEGEEREGNGTARPWWKIW